MTQRILLADDEEAITSELAPLLERSGFEEVVARDGTEALRLAGALAAFFVRHPLPAGDPKLPRLANAPGREVRRPAR